MKAVVMAGGEGSRLRPITSNVPKPLVPVGNTPIIEHIFALLKRHGIRDVVATLHYLADEIQGAFGDGAELGINLSYSIEDTPLGTAGSVKQAQSMLDDSEPFLIISGDALTDCDLSKAIEFHKSKGSLATLILYRVPTPLDFGVVITDEDGKIVRFLEKPGWSEVFSDTVNTGMYILEPEIFETMVEGRNYDWSRDIFPRLLEEGKPMFGYIMDGYWCDVGSISQYREAQEDLMSGGVDLPLPYPDIGNRSYVAASAMIDESAEIVAPVIIGEFCRVKKGACVGPYTVLGDQSVVEENATVERTVVWDNAYVGANADLRSAVIGSRATIKMDCVVSEDAVVGDRCLIDVGSIIRPRVKLWPDKIIERGSTVTMSLVWGNKWRGNLFRELGVAGLSNIEITPDFACRLGSAYGSCFPSNSRIVVSRDSTRSSRMIKRAIMSSLLSVGCSVIDLHSCALPIARHYIRRSRATGAVSVRKLPGNARVTLIEFLDENGGYLSRATERRVENAFFREDYRRTDSDDLGVIENAELAVEGYQSDFLRNVGEVQSARNLRVVCDYGYSALGSFYPAMLSKLGVESISLNGYNDAKASPRTPEEIDRHVSNLRSIVSNLGYDMGVLFTDEGERLSLVDERGKAVVGNELLAAMSALAAKCHPGAKVAVGVTSTSKLEEIVSGYGGQIVRTRADVRSLMESSSDSQVTLGGDDRGGFIFPEFHAGFDAPFCFGKLVMMLKKTGMRLGEVVASLPDFHVAYASVNCPWEVKGSVMRQISEEGARSERVEMVDGIKIFNEESWVLVLPDSIEPVFHVYAESSSDDLSQQLVKAYSRKILVLQGTG